jgi:hypothetical protein
MGKFNIGDEVRDTSSTFEAFKDLGVERLASRIHDLKGMGYNITSEIKSSKNRFGETTYYKAYKLAEEEN